MDQYIGKMLDNRYEILERIGTGGMAIVYKAMDHRLNRSVAIKILKSDLAQDDEFRRRFHAESQAVAQLSHPNIVSVYDVSRGGDTEYIVMELIDGITLKQYMEKRGQLNWRESLHFITQIMRGLAHAHSRSIIHRDIKPQNVMVLRDGSVKVADFGIACLENAAQTLTQEALGSVHYISPEQARGDRTDARSDIYSAGVVLYEMLTGRLPFEGDSAVSVAIQHLSSIPLAPREIKPDIPEQLELICMKAMAPDLDRRYISAEAMIADLEIFRKNPGVDLDFDLTDLRPEEPDEPTVLLHSTGSHRAGAERDRRDRYENDRHYYPADRRESRRAGTNGRQVALIAGAAVTALVLVFFLFRGIFASFMAPPPSQYTVPKVTEYTLEEARRMEDVTNGTFSIIEAGREFDDNVPEGIILRQDPAPETVKKGELPIPIQVWVSAGEDTGEMIDVTNRTYAEAQVLLRELKNRYDLEFAAPTEETSDKITQGYIISTIPAEGDTLKEGDTIYFVISKGPATKPLIDFKNQPLSWALDQLPTLGLTDGGYETQPSDTVPQGNIISHTPSAGEQVPDGTPIHFIVSSGPENVVPQVETVIIPLPVDKEIVQLRIVQDGNVLIDDMIDCVQWGYSYPQEISGTGSTYLLEIYIDGELSPLSGQREFGNG